MLYFKGSVSTAEGSSLIKFGNTTVMCGIKAVSISLGKADSTCLSWAHTPVISWAVCLGTVVSINPVTGY